MVTCLGERDVCRINHATVTQYQENGARTPKFLWAPVYVLQIALYQLINGCLL